MLRAGDTGDWIGTFVGHRGAVWCCAMDPEGRKAATGAADFSAKVWDVNTGSELLNIPQEHIVRAVDLSFSDGGRRLLTANNKQQVYVYDLESNLTPIISLPGQKKTIRRCLWANDDRVALTISDDKTMNLWDLTTNNSDRLVWSAFLSECPVDAQILPPLPGSSVARVVVAQGMNVCLYELDYRTGCQSGSLPPEPVSKFELPCPLFTAHLNPTGDMIVCGGENNLLYRLDAITGEILESCRGHFGPVHCARFSPDGHLFASGSEDGFVRLWQTQVGENYGLWKMVEQSSPLVTAAS